VATVSSPATFSTAPLASKRARWRYSTFGLVWQRSEFILLSPLGCVGGLPWLDWNLVTKGKEMFAKRHDVGIHVEMDAD